MDYLFNKIVLNVSEKYKVSTYYIVDDSLKYVSLVCENRYHFGYVDTDYIGDFISDSTNEGSFDYYVICNHSPLLWQNSYFDVINESQCRIVNVKTLSGNNKLIKKKKSTQKDVLKRFSTNRKKLF